MKVEENVRGTYLLWRVVMQDGKEIVRIDNAYNDLPDEKKMEVLENLFKFIKSETYKLNQ